jgi:hypothetical protein
MSPEEVEASESTGDDISSDLMRDEQRLASDTLSLLPEKEDRLAVPSPSSSLMQRSTPSQLESSSGSHTELLSSSKEEEQQLSFSSSPSSPSWSSFSSSPSPSPLSSWPSRWLRLPPQTERVFFFFFFFFFFFSFFFSFLLLLHARLLPLKALPFPGALEDKGKEGT